MPKLSDRQAAKVATTRLPDHVRARLDQQRAGRLWLLLGADWTERRTQAIRDQRTAAGLGYPEFPWSE